MGLVHQNMIDPTIKAVKHPFCHARIGQQIAGFANKIVEIKPPQLLLAHLVKRQEGGRKTMQCLAAQRGLHRQPHIAGVFDAAHQIF